MTIHWTPTRTGIVFMAMTTLAGACLDVPIVQIDEPSDGGDGGLREVDVTTDGQRPCEACLQAPPDPGPGCGPFFEVCFADQACRDTMTCAIATGCLELPDQGQVIDCGRPCAFQAGLDPTKPSIDYVIDLATCGTTTCGTICRGPTATAPRR
jgi:hypothetical protein